MTKTDYKREAMFWKAECYNGLSDYYDEVMKFHVPEFVTGILVGISLISLLLLAILGVLS